MTVQFYTNKVTCWFILVKLAQAKEECRAVVLSRLQRMVNVGTCTYMQGHTVTVLHYVHSPVSVHIVYMYKHVYMYRCILNWQGVSHLTRFTMCGLKAIVYGMGLDESRTRRVNYVHVVIHQVAAFEVH